MRIELILLTSLGVLLSGIAGIGLYQNKNKANFVIFIVLVNAILTSIPSIQALMGVPQTGSFFLSFFPGSEITLRIDRLSAWFILIINLTSVNGIIYGKGYLQSYLHLSTNLHLHWIFYMLFHISMVWVCMIDHGLFFLIAWELMSVSSLFLVIFEFQNKETLKAGINYMIQMHLSVAFLTAGVLWMYIETGSFSLTMLNKLGTSSNGIWIIVLFFIGFAIKAGFLPFHTWLPHAHPAAPSHVSGVMSGVIVKLGIFGIIRLLPGLGNQTLLAGEILLSLSIITALFGIMNAAVKYDFKRSLAFCTVENIGLIGLGLGLALMGIGINNPELTMLGFSGALLHVLNHSLFKSLLFFGAGSVYQQTHTRNIEKLGGLIKAMPFTAALFLLGAMAIGGLPPFNGFVSEFMLYKGFFEGIHSLPGLPQLILLILSMLGLVLVGGISIFAFTRMFGIIFLGNPRSELHHQPKESSRTMLLPQILIGTIMLSIGVFPVGYLNIVKDVASELIPNTFLPSGYILTNSTNQVLSISRASTIFILILAGLAMIRYAMGKNKATCTYETWGCGYVGSIPRAQYTGRSYARTFGGLMGVVLKQRKKYLPINTDELYPEKRTFSSYYFDVIEKFMVDPMVRFSRLALNRFQFIQNGKIQSYVIYGLFFILAIFIGSLLNLIN